MSANHTPGPWRVVPGMHTIEAQRTAGGYVRWVDIARCPGQYEEGETEANARRIVACVNYCEGVQTLEIESAPKHLRLRQLLDMIDNDLPRHNKAGEILSDLSREVEAERDTMKALNAELVEALQLVPALRPLMLKEMGYVPESVLNITNAARAVLDRVSK